VEQRSMEAAVKMSLAVAFAVAAFLWVLTGG
jgi:hypothetical protein